MPGLDDLSLTELESMRVQRLTLDGFPGAKITSTHRSPEHNAKVGGVKNSQHLSDTAIDFAGVRGVTPAQARAYYAEHGVELTEALDEGDHMHVAWGPKGGAQKPQQAAPSLDSLSLEQLEALRAQVAGQAPKAPAPKPKVSTAKDVAKGGAGGTVRGVAGVGDMLGGGLFSVPSLLDQAGNVANVFGAKNAALALHGTANAMSNPIGKAAERNIPVANYRAETLPGKVAEKVGEFLPNALLPGGAGKGLATQAVGRSVNVLAPAAGAVAGREGAKAAGFGEVGQAVGEFAGSMVGAGAPRKVSLPAKKAAAPQLTEIQAQRTAAYKAVDDAGVKFKPQAVSSLAQGIEDELKAALINKDLHPKAAAALKIIQANKNKPLTLSEIDQFRQVVSRDVAGSIDKGERFMGRKILANIDEFIGSAGPEQVSAGDPVKAAQLIRNARQLHQRASKIEAVNNATEKAKNRTASTYSGGNIDNATRQELRKVLERSRGLTSDETAQLKSIVYGGKGQNALRLVGKLSPSGNGLMAALNLGAAAAGGPIGAIPGAVGMGAKMLADGATQAKVARLVDIMARGGKPALDAEAQLANLAKRDRQIAAIYRRVAERVAVPAGVALSGLSQSQAAAQEAR